MPPLSQRPRRRRFHDERTERQRPHQRQPVAEEEEDEEEEEGEEEGDYEDEEGPEEPVHLRGSGPSQQRQRLPAAASRARVEEDSEADDDDDDGDDDPRRPQADRQVAYQELLAKKLVRYALACEPRRQPIRRQAVKEQGEWCLCRSVGFSASNSISSPRQPGQALPQRVPHGPGPAACYLWHGDG